MEGLSGIVWREMSGSILVSCSRQGILYEVGFALRFSVLNPSCRNVACDAVGTGT